MGSVALTHQKKTTVAKAVDLLVGAAVVSEWKLQEAMQIVQRTQQPMERVLVEFQFISREVMEATIRFQLMIAESMLPESTAVKALALLRHGNMNIREALAILGWGSSEDRAENQLGEFLRDACVISERTYELALQKTRQEFCSFGAFLVLKNFISLNVLNASLHALSLVRQGQLSRSKATSIIKFACDSGLSIWDALGNAGFSMDYVTNSQLSLGELLTQSSLISELDRAALVEFSIIEKRRLGDLLVNQGLTSQRTLTSALVLQKLARAKAISRREACQILKAIDSEGTDLRAQLVSRYAQGESKLASEAIELLFKAGIVSNADIEIGTIYAGDYGIDTLRGLLLSDSINSKTMQLACSLVFQLRFNKIDRDEALLALRNCKSKSAGLEAAQNFLRLTYNVAEAEKSLANGSGGESSARAPLRCYDRRLSQGITAALILLAVATVLVFIKADPLYIPAAGAILFLLNLARMKVNTVN